MKMINVRSGGLVGVETRGVVDGKLGTCDADGLRQVRPGVGGPPEVSWHASGRVRRGDRLRVADARI